MGDPLDDLASYTGTSLDLMAKKNKRTQNLATKRRLQIPLKHSHAVVTSSQTFIGSSLEPE